MSRWRRHPVLYEVNAHLWLAQLSRRHGQRVDLSNVPEPEIELLAAYRPDGVWLMGVWALSPASRQVALQHPDLQLEFRRALPDLRDEDVIGSPFAIRDYAVDGRLGGDCALQDFRERLARRGTRLMLDFVPNHVAIDHPWTETHPEYLVSSQHEELTMGRPEPGASPGPYYFAKEVQGKRTIFAHGRDPYFPPWTDTVQINYDNPAARTAMIATLQRIAERCDGVRCDMAMLITNDVFRRTWKQTIPPPSSRGDQVESPKSEFWEEAIPAVKSDHPDFMFVGEVYWNMELTLQRQGFDFTYDKTLYDRLTNRDPDAVRGHLQAELGFQSRLARFIENHDEPRAIAAMGLENSKAAAVLVATLPGMRMFHQGQFEGQRVRMPVQLDRCRDEEPIPGLAGFYQRLLDAAAEDVFHEGECTLLDPRPAWDGNTSWRNIVAFLWTLGECEATLVAVNLGGDRSQAYLPLPGAGWAGKTWLLRERLGGPTYVRDGDQLLAEGLYVELEPSAFHFFGIGPTGAADQRHDS